MLALLETLKSALRDFAAREEKLNSDFHSRSGVEIKAFETAKEKQTADAAEALAKAEVDFQSAKEQRRARFEQRKTRLNLAHNNARKRVLDEISKQEADIKYAVQTGSLDAERVRDEKIAAGVTAFEDFSRRATETNDRFAALETSAKKTFNGYRGFKRLLAADREWPQPDLSPDENQLLDELQRLEKKIGDDLRHYRGRFPAAVFRFLPIWLWVVLLVGFVVAVFALHLPHWYVPVSVG